MTHETTEYRYLARYDGIRASLPIKDVAVIPIKFKN